MKSVTYDSLTGGRLTIGDGQFYDWSDTTAGGTTAGFTKDKPPRPVSVRYEIKGVGTKFFFGDDLVTVKSKARFSGIVDGKRANGILNGRVKLEAASTIKEKNRDIKITGITEVFRFRDESGKNVKSRFKAEFTGKASFVNDFILTNGYNSYLPSSARTSDSFARSKGYFSFAGIEDYFRQGSGFGLELFG